MSSNMEKDSKSPEAFNNYSYGPLSALNKTRFGTTIPNRIFVGGLPQDATEADLKSLFSSFGNVVEVNIIIDHLGASKGYGFVTFESSEEARKVLKESDNLLFKGKKLNMAIAIRKQNFPSCYDGVSLMTSGPFFYSNGPLPMSTLTNETCPQYNLNDHMYSMNFGHNPNLISSAYPFMYQQPIYLAQYPIAHPTTTFHPQHTCTYNGANFQGNVPTAPVSYPPSSFYSLNTNLIPAAYVTSNGTLSSPAGSWRLPTPTNEYIPYVNTLVSLKK